jgi:hypothetical protein
MFDDQPDQIHEQRAVVTMPTEFVDGFDAVV